MSKLLIAGVFMALSTAAAAGETGTINQAGPYETTLRFYLHPAHGFPGKAEASPVEAANIEQGAAVADAKKGKPPTAASRETQWRPPATRQVSYIEPAAVRTDETPPRSPR